MYRVTRATSARAVRVLLSLHVGGRVMGIGVRVRDSPIYVVDRRGGQASRQALPQIVALLQ